MMPDLPKPMGEFGQVEGQAPMLDGLEGHRIHEPPGRLRHPSPSHQPVSGPGIATDAGMTRRKHDRRRPRVARGAEPLNPR